MDNRTYLLQTGSGQYSPPLTVETLIAYARSGNVRPETFLFDQRASAWLPAHQIPELRAVFGDTPPANIPSFHTRMPASQPRSSMSRGAKAAIGFGLTLFLFLCGGGVYGMVALIRLGIEESRKPTTFASTNGRCEVSAPTTWSETGDTHDNTILEIADPVQSVYVTVMEEPVTDFADDLDLEDYAVLARERYEEFLEKPKVVKRTDLKIGDRNAIQFELEGITESRRFKYLLVAVQTPTHFYQIVAHGAASSFDRHREELQKAIDSFKAHPDELDEEEDSDEESPAEGGTA